MATVSELTSKNIASTQANVQTWGNIVVNVKVYGAKGDGVTDDSDAFINAINYAIDNDIPFICPPGEYLVTKKVIKDNFDRLTMIGYNAIIRNHVSDWLTLGDFSTDIDGYFSQTVTTVKNITISGFTFEPIDSEFNTIKANRHSYATPILLSSAENVMIKENTFKNYDFSAIDFAAPSKNIDILNNRFESDIEADTTYGVRPFCYVAPLDAYNDEDGTLLYSAPTVYHENITIEGNYFKNITRSILSWNVHNSRYINNTFEKPLKRTISITNWNFNCLVEGNKHLVEDNTTYTLSTCIRIGHGCENIIITNELFTGLLTNVVPNNLLKVIHQGEVGRSIQISNCIFDIVGANYTIIVERNSESKIVDNYFLQTNLRGNVLEIANTALTGVANYEQPAIEFSRNVVKKASRVIILNTDQEGVIPKEVICNENRFEVLIQNGIFSTSATTTKPWKVSSKGNELVLGAFNYYVNNGGGFTIREYDKLERALQTISTGAVTSITLNWREYGGEEWFIAPDGGISLTVTDITGEIAVGQKLTIMSGASGAGGELIFPYGSNFRTKGGVNAVLVANQSIAFVIRAGIWFEISRSF